MKVSWKEFAQRRNLNLRAFRTLSYEEYARWCTIRGVAPVPKEVFEDVKEVVHKNNIDEEAAVVTVINPKFSETQLKKMRKAELSNLCKEHGIEMGNSETKKQLISKLLKLNNS